MIFGSLRQLSQIIRKSDHPIGSLNFKVHQKSSFWNLKAFFHLFLIFDKFNNILKDSTSFLKTIIIFFVDLCSSQILNIENV